MRDNGMTTGRVIELRDGQIIVSRADEAGRIVFANQDFVEISGFSEAELLGQPHNIIRHPDMPAAVFADMWRDIKAGRPWVGTIKNRCKNGDAYWVEAHVSPLWEGDHLAGYLSMRRKARPEQIQAAEKLYGELRDGSASGPIFAHGTAHRRGLLGCLRRAVRQASLGSKLVLASLLAAIVILGITSYLLATHITRSLDNNARLQLSHDVGLLRAAISSRIDNANSTAIEYSKILADQIDETLGGQHNASRESFLALLAANGKSSGKPLDLFLRDLRGSGSIFVLTPQGFERRLSTALNERGESAIGSYLATDHPAHATLLAGQPYVGPARIFGRQYLSRYTPIFDARGRVMGASGIAIDIGEQLEPLKAQLRAIQVGNSGYYYIIDVTPGRYFGELVLHPYKEGRNLLDFKLDGGAQLVNKMIKQQRGEITYFWKNEEAGENHSHKKLVIFETLDMPHWIIAGGTTMDEFTALTQHIVWLVVAGGLAMAGAIFAVIVLLLRKLVLEPLNSQVLPTFRAISSGNFETPLDVQGDDEIAHLLLGLESLRNRLAFDNDRERALARARESARQAAEALAQARADFLANMSHEIRTPLNGVIGLSHLLQRSPLTPHDMDYVRRIESAGKLLLAIVNDILDFSKIDAGGLQLEEEDFDLDEILDNLSNLMRSKAQEKKLILEYVVAPDVPHSLRGDTLRLSQVLANLVGNAIKFTEQGGVTVHIDCLQHGTDRVALEFRIQDTGIGMSAEQQEQLFQAFTQADNSVTRKYGGTGLGLAITKRLIEKMGGSIAVDSTPHAGSTFIVRMSLARGTTAERQPATSNYRFLVVDDNELARHVLARLLQKHGCTVDTDDSGSAALTRLRTDERGFDCIMIDLNMPGIDGLTLAGMLRSKLGKRTHLVMVTSENPQAADLRGSLDVFDEIIEKPATSARVREILAHMQSRDERPIVRAAPVPAMPLSGTTVLVAEDVPTNQLVVRELLESLGATVRLADNGALALRQLAEHGDQIDLILMDIQMPELDGIEATRRIRAGSIRPDIPIIALTAHALEDERQRTAIAGMNDFLTKPIDPDQLLDKVRRYARPKAAMARPSITQPPEGPTTQRVAAAPREPALGKQQAAATVEPFPALPGIDSTDGLRRMMNKASLYEKVLRDFRTRFTGEAERIRQAIAAGDRDSATRMAHSVKGTGGTIGARELFARAQALEESIKGARPDQGEQLSAFESELEYVLGGIAAAFPPRP